MTGSGRKEKQRCEAGSNAIPSGSPPGIRRNAPSRIARRESIPASERSTTPAIRPFTALVAVTAKRQNATSTPTGSTKTAIELKPKEQRTEVLIMSVNKVIVIGNLGANPDVRALPSGQNVVELLAGDDRAVQGSQRRTAEADRMASRG